MTETEILSGVLQREGGLREAVQRPDGSWDPLTYRGITDRTLGEWRRLDRPATREELLAMSLEETAAIYRQRYTLDPGFTPDNVPFEPLRLQLIDFGINSGPARAIRWLQRVIGVDPSGRLDRHTTDWLYAHAGYLHLVNDALCAARLYMIDRATDTGTMRKADEEGVESRALTFFLSTP